METMESNAALLQAARRSSQYAHKIKDSRFIKASTSFRAKEREDDCSRYDKLPKQIDDLVEGESPKRFKRRKMECDIVAR